METAHQESALSSAQGQHAAELANRLSALAEQHRQAAAAEKIRAIAVAVDAVRSEASEQASMAGSERMQAMQRQLDVLTAEGAAMSAELLIARRGSDAMRHSAEQAAQQIAQQAARLRELEELNDVRQRECQARGITPTIAPHRTCSLSAVPKCVGQTALDGVGSAWGEPDAGCAGRCVGLVQRTLVHLRCVGLVQRLEQELRAKDEALSELRANVSESARARAELDSALRAAQHEAQAAAGTAAAYQVLLSGRPRRSVHSTSAATARFGSR
jgi:hypothetical protein